MHVAVPQWFNALVLLWHLPLFYFVFLGLVGKTGPAWLALISISAFLCIKWTGIENINLDSCPIAYQRVARAGHWLSTCTLCLWHAYLHRLIKPQAP